MKILVTGANGFIGKNLIQTMKTLNEYPSKMQILEYHKGENMEALEKFTDICDFIIHLAGANRPDDPKEFRVVNEGITEKLCYMLKKRNNNCPIIYASSTQIGRDNEYAKSKENAEHILKLLQHENGNPLYLYRLTNVFGKWTKPYYNSVVATWCYEIARDIEITIHNASTMLSLCYIDDVIADFITCLNGEKQVKNDVLSIEPTYEITLENLAELLKEFHESRENRTLIHQDNEFTKKLYATYLSYLPIDQFSYELTMHRDARGSFTEFIKLKEYGQFSINISHPGISKGEHWHHTKNEKFLVVSGKGVIQLRNIVDNHIIEYTVSDQKLEVIDIPVGYTHNIVNVGTSDMVTVMWANELYDVHNPDTFPEIVNKREKDE